MVKDNSTAPITATTGQKAKKIGMVTCVSFCVGTMIGGGVFALSGTVVNAAGSGSTLGFISAGIIMLFSALCFAAVAARAPVGESSYDPVGTYLGPVWRFLTMWAFYIVGVSAVAFVLVSFGTYMLYFLPREMQWCGLIIALLAAVFLTILNFGSTTMIGKAETTMVSFKVLVLFILIIFGFIVFQPERLVSLHGSMTAPGSVLYASAILFTAYTGFNVVTNMASQVENPQKIVPLSIIFSLILVTLIYTFIIIALIMSDVKHFGNAGLAQAAEALGAKFGMAGVLGTLVAICACVSTLSGANANVLSSAELIVDMARNGDVPSEMGRLTDKGRPVVSVLITGIVAIVLIASDAFETVVVLSNVATVIALIIVAVVSLVLARKKWPGKGWKLPFGYTIPVIAILGALSNLYQYTWWQNILGFALVAVGLIFYFYRHHSDQKTVMHIKAHLDAGNTPLRRILSKSPPQTITQEQAVAAYQKNQVEEKPAPVAEEKPTQVV